MTIDRERVIYYIVATVLNIVVFFTTPIGKFFLGLFIGIVGMGMIEIIFN